MRGSIASAEAPLRAPRGADGVVLCRALVLVCAPRGALVAGLMVGVVGCHPPASAPLDAPKDMFLGAAGEGAGAVERAPAAEAGEGEVAVSDVSGDMVNLDAAPRADERWRARDPAYVAFEGACEGEGASIVVAAVGDLLLHHELQIQAFAAPERHRALWSGVEDLLMRADLTYGNLEGPMAAGLDREGREVEDPGLVFDRVVYTAYPRFNFHASLAEDLVRSGFDVVSTANNHALDRGALGVDRTIAALRAAKLAYTGTRARGDAAARWYTITRSKGIGVAWLACTELMNVRPDAEGQVLRCGDKAVAATIRALKEDRSVDAVIVTPHWGKEYAPEPRASQVTLAQRWAEAGATAIFGSHPHVNQRWEKLVTSGGREALVIYSLGNFASHQPELPRRSSALFYVGLRRGADGQARVFGARYVPLHVRQEGERFFVEAVDRVGGPAESRAFTAGIFGEANLIRPEEALRLAPHCGD
jgi:hypothetical protein